MAPYRKWTCSYIASSVLFNGYFIHEEVNGLIYYILMDMLYPLFLFKNAVELLDTVYWANNLEILFDNQK